MRAGSGFCHWFTYLYNVLSTSSDDKNWECLSSSLQGHEVEATVKSEAYMELQDAGRNNPTSGLLHH